MKQVLAKILATMLIFTTIPVIGACSKINEIKMYNIETKQIETLNIEDYIAGVVAGEMNNNWPIEALKAQCILARTFTYDFLQNKSSKYNGADISNDINEAQAYDSKKINDKIKEAVKETSGLVLKYDDYYINAWFHSNSGGVTETSTIGLNTESNPPYIKSIRSVETSDNSDNYNWNYTFSKAEILRALASLGLSVSTINNIEVGDKSDSGRLLSLKVGDKLVNANTFRLAVGSTKLKSTLINSILVDKESVTFTGVGYGHGVGMSQWGAKILADNGRDYSYIVNYYFDNVKIVKN